MQFVYTPCIGEARPRDARRSVVTTLEQGNDARPHHFLKFVRITWRGNK
jgi:hypothetical protein